MTMALSDIIADEELSIRAPVTGYKSAATNKGILEKLRDNDDENKTNLETQKTAWEIHDHSSDGAPLGTGGVNSIVSGAVTTTKIKDLAVSSSKLQDGSIGNGKIADGTVAAAAFGDANTQSFGPIAAGGSTTINFNGLGYVPLFHVESASREYLGVGGRTTTTIQIENSHLSSAISGVVVFRGS